MTNRLTCVPAYGRDYKSKKAVVEAWKKGTDFRIQDISSQYDGSYINLEDAEKTAPITLNIRYKQLQQVAVINVAKPKPQPTVEQIAALRRYRDAVLVFTTDWRADLRADWLRGGSKHVNADDYSLLHQLRNDFGPSWLATFKIPAVQA